MHSLTLITIVLVSLAIGSFLNVVIYRYPLMMFQSWKQEAREFLLQQGESVSAQNTPS